MNDGEDSFRTWYHRAFSIRALDDHELSNLGAILEKAWAPYRDAFREGDSEGRDARDVMGRTLIELALGGIRDEKQLVRAAQRALLKQRSDQLTVSTCGHNGLKQDSSTED
jgi:hypothetical protein